MKKLQKQLNINFYKKILNKDTYFVLAHYNSISTENWIEYKQKLNKDNIFFKVVQNKLFSHSLTKTKYANLSNSIIGPTIIFYSQEGNNNFSNLVNFLNNNKSSFLMTIIKFENKLFSHSDCEKIQKIIDIDPKKELISFLNYQNSKLPSLMSDQNRKLMNIVSNINGKK